jgi:gas vesicle protein
MKKIWIYGIILFSIVFIAVAVIFKIFDMEILPSQFYGALIGVVITAIITVFLLQGQTANEEQREKSVKVFEKKQEIYHNFLEELKRIIQDGEITIGTKSDDSTEKIDELKDLIFQLGYLQMHADAKIMDDILQHIATIIRLMNEFDSTRDENKQRELPEYYAQLSQNLFEIIASLKLDLYGGDNASKPIAKERMEAILKECGGLYVRTNDFDEYEAVNCFWYGIQKQLRNKGYQIPENDFDNRLKAFLTFKANTANDIRFQFQVYDAPRLDFAVDFNVQLLPDGYYYGFTSNNFGRINELEEYEIIVNYVKTLSPLFNNNSVWYGYKKSERFNLNFKSKDSPSFDELKDPRKRERLIAEIANEMDSFITGFINIAKQNDL